MSDLFSRVTSSSDVSAIRSGLPQPPAAPPPVTNAPPPVYFDLTLFDEAGSQVVETVSPSGKYLLVMTGDIDCHGHVPQEGVVIASSITLELQVRKDINTIFSIASEELKYKLSYEQAANFEELLPITIPPKHPTCTLTFELVYRKGNKKHARLEIAAKLEIRLEGERSPHVDEVPQIVEVDNKPLQRFNKEVLEIVDLPRDLPPKVALLLVEPFTAQKNHFTVCGWSDYKDLLRTDSMPIIKASLAQLFIQRDANNNLVNSEIDILNRVSRFSRRRLAELRVWLKALYEQYSKDLCLIIIDKTQFEFPWEMFEFHSNHYLGAMVKVIRWMSFSHFDNFYRLQFAEDPPLFSGSVVAYLDKGLGTHVIQAENEMLEDILVDGCNSLEELETRIHQSLSDIGLVYVGCHGHQGEVLYPQQAEHMNIRQRRSEQLTALDLELSEPKTLPRPLFFINACESARFTYDEDDDPYGFVDAIMTFFASGFIGPVGEVDILEASLIAREILNLLKSSEGLPVAEILRRLREKVGQQWTASKDLPRTEKLKAASKFLFMFMYVYYGNPFANLRLLRMAKKPAMEVGI